MSQPIVWMKNVDALKARDKKLDNGQFVRHENGGYAGRWPGKVTEKLGKWEQNGYDSGEWKVKITSKYLEDPVVARVNVEREVGTRVQFNLEDVKIDETGHEAVTFFETEYRVDRVTNVASTPTANPDFQRNRFPDSDY